MILEHIILGGYGQFVWPAFTFTFVSCFFLYTKSKKELQKQQKLFLSEFEKLEIIKIGVEKRKEISNEVFSKSSTF